MKKLKLFLSVALMLAAFVLQAQRFSDPIKIGGTAADTASKRSSTVVSWTSSEFAQSTDAPGYFKFFLDVDTVGSVGKAKYKIYVQERPAGSQYWTVSQTTWGSSSGWTKGDTVWTITNQSATTSPGLVSKYYRLMITPYDSTQKIRIWGYLVKW